MKKKNSKGFSFVELIVVVSIMAILMGAGISYFGSFIDDMKYKNILSKVTETINDFDKKIASRQSFDYKIKFLKDKNYYLIYENIVGNDINIEFDGIDNSGTGSFSFSGTHSGTGTIKYYKSYKFQTELEIPWNGTFTGSLGEKSNYKITGSFSGNTLNNIYFRYYSLDQKVGIILNSNDCEIINVLGKKTGNCSLEFKNDKGQKEILEIK